jgi:hypothetical protein
MRTKNTVIDRRKPKKQKVAKPNPATSIAERYMELRRLRERISEAESRGYAR